MKMFENNVEHGSDEKFEELIKKGDIRNYLKASPLESGERSSFDRELTEEYYYSHLYAHSDKAEQLICRIKDKIECDNTHNFILSGYKGCGKSTFVRYFMRNIQTRTILINFDDNWEPDVGIKKNIVMELNNRIYNDLQPKNGESAGKVVSKYLEIFQFSENNKYRIKEIDMNNYFTYFSEKLAYALRLHNERKISKMLDYYKTDILMHTISGTINEMLMLIIFWDIAEKFANGLQSQCCIIFENLDVIYNTKDVPDMIKNVVAFRSNIDKICRNIYYQGNPIGTPTQDYLLLFVMRETTKAEFSGCIDHFSDRKVRFESFPDISDIYNLYNIVEQRCQYLEKLLKEKSEYETIDTYVKLCDSINLLKKILEEPYLQDNLFKMLNNDYRTSAELLGSFDFNNENFVQVCNRMMTYDKDSKDWSKFGFRSIFFREIFNLFVKEGYFGKVRKFEYTVTKNGEKCAVNIERMMLLYLNNSYDAVAKKNNSMKEFVSLDILFSEIKKFCKDSNLIVDALWQMYDLRKEAKWNHLVTFDNMQNITHEELKKEMDALEKKQSDYRYAKVKITKSGEIYLDYILSHFEYYAARCTDGAQSSLFFTTAEEICNGSFLESVLKKEIKEIKDCCKRLYHFFKYVFNTIDEFKEDKFLDTKFATVRVSTRNNNISKMYHCERIIYSNIGYLNRFRFYSFEMLDEVLKRGGFDKDIDIKKSIRLFPKIDKVAYENWPEQVFSEKICKCMIKGRDEKQVGIQKIQIIMSDEKIIESELQLKNIILVLKACVNVRIIDGISSFIGMFGLYGREKCTVYSKGTSKICDAFIASIDKIQKEKFLDFTTSIDVDTGEKIISEKNRLKRQKKHVKNKSKL